ncbi:uncharacterized protein LOC117167990 [Belonocnema kinseyi]|uniref:uncharacterized protein LOC117167990 n=1 Tax=Belonocnema kinseyi TaxID=2817044 RepID=UPI00143DA6F5|nr:uncharacterized protein LOC117167990 [Belonocnema kinseyi]XP_033209185.1 uncharacterized protein LOC117167990 [Belonocnema kinseyi]
MLTTTTHCQVTGSFEGIYEEIQIDETSIVQPTIEESEALNILDSEEWSHRNSAILKTKKSPALQRQASAATAAQREQVILDKIVLGRKIKKTSNQRFKKRSEEFEALI